MVTLSVGELAALINVFTLIIVTIVDRLIEFIVRNFSAVRLRKNRRAPVIHDSDTWLLNIPRSIFKFYKYPAIICTLICSVLLVSTELITELGVEAQKDCGPKTVYGPIISNQIIANVSDAEIASASLAISRLQFVDRNNFSFVPRGFPRQVNENICISCFSQNTSNFIIKNCTVNEFKTYPKGQLSVKINSTIEAFGTVVTSFVDNRSGNEFKGTGDLTRNLEKCGMFIFQSHIIRKKNNTSPKRYRAKYFEYMQDFDPCQSLINSAGKAKGKSIVETTKEDVISYSIECDAADDLESMRFEKSLRAYRSMQLENTMEVARVINNVHFEKITEEDIYRSVLSAKIIDNSPSGSGEYKEYFECGRYNRIFVVPFCLILVLIGLLGTGSLFLMKKYGGFQIPNSSKAWYREAQLGNGRVVETTHKPNRDFFSISTDELYLDGEEVLIDTGSEGRSSNRYQISGQITPSSFEYDYFQNSRSNPSSLGYPREPETVLHVS